MYNEFGVDGGPTAKLFAPKVAVLQKFLTSTFGDAPTIDVRHFVAASLSLKGLGGLLFIFGSPIGAYLLMYNLVFTSPILYDFYNYNIDEPEFEALGLEFLQCLALFGALLYFIGMKNSIPRRQIKKKTARPKTA